MIDTTYYNQICPSHGLLTIKGLHYEGYKGKPASASASDCLIIAYEHNFTCYLVNLRSLL